MSLFHRLFATGSFLWLASMYVFLVGHLGILRGGFVVLPGLAVIAAIAVLSGGLPSYFRGSGAREAALSASIVGVILLILPLVSTPPVSRDALIHHLAVPELYLEAGGIYEIPFMGFSYLPMNLDYLYIIPLYLGIDTAARYIHFGFALLTALLIYDYIREKVSTFYGLVAALVFLSTPVVVKLSASAYVDLGVTFYSTLSVVALLKWMDEDRKRYLLFSAMAGGFAVGVKYNGAVTVFILSVFVLWYSTRKKGLLTGIKEFSLYSLVPALLFLPYLIRNYIWVGNPFHPLMGGMIKGVDRLYIGEALSPVEKRYILYGENTLDILLVPFRIFLEGRDSSMQHFDGVLNPVFVAFIPLMFLVGKKKGWFGYLVCFCFLYLYVAFFTTDLVTRYVLPALAVFIILVALAIKEGLERRYARHVVVLLLAAMFLFNLSYVYGLYERYRPLGYVTGRETRDAYLLRVLPDYEVVLWANRNLPEDARVIFFFTGERGYYWQRDYYYEGRLGENLIRLVMGSRTSDELRDKLSRKGFTHIFINNHLFEKFSYDNFDVRGLALLSGLFRDHLTMLYSARGFSLYEIGHKG